MDALDPKVIERLIENAIMDVIDLKIWDEDIHDEADQRDLLMNVSRRWSEVKDYLKEEE